MFLVVAGGRGPGLVGEAGALVVVLVVNTRGVTVQVDVPRARDDEVDGAVESSLGHALGVRTGPRTCLPPVEDTDTDVVEGPVVATVPGVRPRPPLAEGRPVAVLE